MIPCPCLPLTTCHTDSLLTNAAKAKATSVDPLQAYIKSPLPGKEPVMLIVVKEAQSIQSIMVLVNNQEETECIADSSLQIISMSAEVANHLEDCLYLFEILPIVYVFIF